MTYEDWYQWRKKFRRWKKHHMKFCTHPECVKKREKVENKFMINS